MVLTMRCRIAQIAMAIYGNGVVKDGTDDVD